MQSAWRGLSHDFARLGHFVLNVSHVARGMAYIERFQELDLRQTASRKLYALNNASQKQFASTYKPCGAASWLL